MNDMLYIFGTCSGTEPIPGRHHVSFAVRHNDKLYWFDAGESCSYTAHTMGVDVRDIRAVFISHPHMDHIGGLGNLMWTIRKLDSRTGGMEGKNIDLFMPDSVTWPAQRLLLSQTEGNFETRFSIRENRIRDGVIFMEDGFQVTALHNSHLPPLPDGTPRTFSFRIETDGLVLAYSGDVGNYPEIKPILQGADIILAETGHHKPVNVCSALNGMGIQPRRLFFIHHGRAILNDPSGCLQEAARVYSGRIDILNDRDTFPLDGLSD